MNIVYPQSYTNAMKYKYGSDSRNPQKEAVDPERQATREMPAYIRWKSIGARTNFLIGRRSDGVVEVDLQRRHLEYSYSLPDRPERMSSILGKTPFVYCIVDVTES